KSEDAHGFLGRVRGGRDVVGSEDRKTGGDADAFLAFGFCLEPLADEEPESGVPGATDSALPLHGFFGGPPPAAMSAQAPSSRPNDPHVAVARSEEHTSELQSRSDLV